MGNSNCSSPSNRQGEFRKAVSELKELNDLAKKRRMMLDILNEDGKNVLRDPQLLQDMVKKAHFLIESKFYVDIITRMIQKTKTSQPGLLNDLVKQMEMKEARKAFTKNQSRCLSIINALSSKDDSQKFRTNCLECLIRNAKYISKKEDSFQWKTQFIDTLKSLLETGNPISIPEVERESALFALLQNMLVIAANEQELTSELIKLLQSLLTKKFLKHGETQGNPLHALIKSPWDKLQANLPFLEQCKRIISIAVRDHRDSCDVTDEKHDTPLDCLATIAFKYEPFNLAPMRLLLDAFPDLSTTTNIPTFFLKLVQRASELIASTHYVEIIQKTSDKYTEISNHQDDGLLESMVNQMKDRAAMQKFAENQGKFLIVINIIISVNNSPESRNNCFLVLYKHARYTPKKGNLKWSEELVDGFKQLLEKGADLTFSFVDDVVSLADTEEYASEKGDESDLDAVSLRTEGSNLELVPQSSQVFTTYTNTNDELHENLDGESDSATASSRTDTQSLSESDTVLYQFLRGFPLILVREMPVANKLKELISLLLTSKYLNNTEPKGTMLHALVNCDWQSLPKDQPDHFWDCYKDIVSEVINAHPILCDELDDDQRTPLHCFIRSMKRSKCAIKIAADVIRHLQTKTNFDKQDKNQDTVLHVLSRTVYKHPALGNELMDLFPLLATSVNVNILNKLEETPYSRIMIGRMQEEYNSNSDNYDMFFKIEQTFHSNMANIELARVGSAVPTLRWLGNELKNENCPPERLLKLLDHLKVVDNWKLCSLNLHNETMASLCDVNNPEYVSWVTEIISILVRNEGFAQNLWNYMFSRRNDNPTQSVMEVLSICAKAGARCNYDERIFLTWMEGIAREEELTLLSIKILTSWVKDFTCSLNYLGYSYWVFHNLIQSAKKLVHSKYQSFNECIDLKELMTCFLYRPMKREISRKLEETSFNECKNWLQRSPLHLAVIFSDSFDYLSQNMIEKYINAKDLHGCTPLHIAYLHQNKQAVKFLHSTKLAKEEVKDLFGVKPKSMGSSIMHNGDDEYGKQCKILLEAQHVLEEIKPVIVMFEREAEALSDEFVKLFKLLIGETKFSEAEVVMAGSLREKLKAGQLDEGDIQLRFTGYCDGHVIIGENTWEEGEFVQELSKNLIESLSKIKWKGIYLRPISVEGPWKFIREGSSSLKGTVISLDVVPVIVQENLNHDDHIQLKKVIKGAPKLKKMWYTTLETCKEMKIFKETRFAYEWDITDNLPTSCRLAIVIAKAFVQAYHYSSEYRHRVKMPITSYMIKTAIFYLLGYNSSEHICHHAATLDSLEKVKTQFEPNAFKRKKLEFHSNPRWTTSEDVDQHKEEARIWTCKIFSLFKYLAENNLKLHTFWDASYPVKETTYEGFAWEAQYVLDICDFFLTRLQTYDEVTSL